MIITIYPLFGTIVVLRVFGLPADFKEGVLFSTYATLVSSVQKGGK